MAAHIHQRVYGSDELPANNAVAPWRENDTGLYAFLNRAYDYADDRMSVADSTLRAMPALRGFMVAVLLALAGLVIYAVMRMDVLYSRNTLAPSRSATWWKRARSMFSNNSPPGREHID